MRLRVLCVGSALLSVLAFGYAHLDGQAKGSLHTFSNPLGNDLADHTWVTDYSQPECPDGGAPRSRYWYATGKCHPVPGDRPRALASAPADLNLASCIAKPDESTFTAGPATARIRYGIDGVCHQISNRVLWATSVGGATPVTVEGARGYGVSRFAYGTYGTPFQWKALQADCGVPSSDDASLTTEIQRLITRRLGATAASDKAAAIMAEHGRLRNSLEELGRNSQLSRGQVAAEANRAINRSLAELGKTMTAEEFERFFDWPRGREIVLVQSEPR